MRELTKLYELSAFALSVIAFVFGACRLFRRGTPKYFRLYVLAAGCYMLEELWVIVNSFFGNGSEDGLLTVRLFGFFGCLCFLLSANVNEFDRIVDEGKSKKAKALALLAPAVLIALYALYAFSPAGTDLAATVIIGFFSLSPALFAAYFSLKHLLLPEDEMGFLRAVRVLDGTALVFYAANFAYPLANLYGTGTVMGLYDLILALILAGMIVLSERGAGRWNSLI